MRNFLYLRKLISGTATLFFLGAVLVATPASALSNCSATAGGINVSKFSAAVRASDMTSTCVSINPNTRYGVASVSKMVTSLTVLSLVDQGKIALDKPFMSQLVPGTMRTPTDTRWNKITVRQLLSHTSGIQVSKGWYFDKSTSSKYGYDWRKIAKNATSIKLFGNPGSVYQYSNTNFVILGVLIDQQAGMPYFQATIKHVFQPLGLAPIDNQEGGIPKITNYAAFSFNAEQALTVQDNKYYGYLAWKNQALGPAGAWFLTAKAATELPIGFKKLLSPGLSAQAMHGSNVNSGYGLGLMKMPGGWGHTGTITGIRAAVTYNLSTGKAGAVLYNGAAFSTGSDLKYAAYSLTTRY